MNSKLAGLALGVATFLLPATAFATGGVGCGIHDENVEFDFEALFGHGVVAPLFQVSASLELKNPKVRHAAALEMDGTHLKQQWFEGNDLKLLFYVETTAKDAPFGAAKLKIEATEPEGEEFALYGKYVLELEGLPSSDGRPLTLEGKVACSAG